MDNINHIPNLNCPACGAPLRQDGACAYCGDPRVHADREKANIDFFTQINIKLTEIPPGVGWLFLVLLVGIPLFILIIGSKFAHNLFSWVFVIVLAIISMISTAIMGAVKREQWQKKMFYEVFYPIIETFMDTNKLSLDEAIQIVNRVVETNTEKTLNGLFTSSVEIERAAYLAK